MMQIPGNGVYSFQHDSACLKAGIWTIAIFGFISWVACIGVAAGLCFEPYASLTTMFIGFLLVLVNVSYIFLTLAITSILSYGDGSSHEDLKNLQRATFRLMAATLVGIGVSVATIINFTVYYYRYYDSPFVALGSSFSFIWLLILGPLTQRYHNKWNAFLKFGAGPVVQGFPQPQAAAYPVTSLEMPQQQATTGTGSPGQAELRTGY
ncbi:uncharacterized protein LOC135201635 [Macrobrachium nipponense]|uniref:uncharacterized protein LOC135201635 n=1 Tax=Macrobrachium nipponense TaxID=159736 RepID=UPI0030C8AC31